MRAGQRSPRFLASAFLFLAPVQLFAQAWGPEKGEAYFTLGYQYASYPYHLDAQGHRHSSEGERSQVHDTAFSLTYGITDRLSATVGLPLVVAKYNGPGPHQRFVMDTNGQPLFNEDGTFRWLPPTIDDGGYHTTATDLSLDLRWMAVSSSLALTPFVGAVLPTHGYEFYGHAAAGRHRKEVRAGLAIGRSLDPILPNAYAQASYSYSWVERILGFKLDYSNVAAELGYSLTPRLGVRVLGVWHISHGGLEFERDPEGIALMNQYPREEDAVRAGARFHGQSLIDLDLNHDRLDRDKYFNLGTAVSFAASPSLDVFAIAFTTVSGVSGHAANIGVAFGASVAFKPFRREPRAPDAAAP